MGYWGVRSYEDDDADEALDEGFERVHGTTYDELMDDRNPLSFEEVQARLANEATLAASVEALREAFEGRPLAEFDEEQRISFCGVVVRHAELGVPIPEDWRTLAIDWLEGESVEWDEADAPARARQRRSEVKRLRAGRADPSCG